MMIDPLEIINEFMIWSPSTTGKPCPIDLLEENRAWLTRLCALAERCAQAENRIKQLEHDLTIASLVMNNLINETPVTDEDMQWARKNIELLDKKWNDDIIKKYKPCGGTDAIIDPKPQRWEKG